MVFGSEGGLEITASAVESRALAPTRVSPNDVPHQQGEGVPGGGAEVGAVDGDLERKKRGREREKRNRTEFTAKKRGESARL